MREMLPYLSDYSIVPSSRVDLFFEKEDFLNGLVGRR
jgi:hypothetical protein